MTATHDTTGRVRPSPIGTAAPLERAGNWPEEVLPILERALVCEFATLTKRGAPLTYPVTPYMGADGHTIDTSTGLSYPAKAERARRDPRVALLFSDPAGSGRPNPPVVLIQGLATVRDADLQANTDRYLALSMVKVPSAYRGTPWFLMRRQGWYLARIWIAVTPLRITWWPDGHLDRAPRRWAAPEGTLAPPSDPPPTGRPLPPWQEAAADWHPRAAEALARLHEPVLTVIGTDGFPLPLRTEGATPTPDGFRLALPTGLPAPINDGPACLTFHTLHTQGGEFASQEHAVFAGEVAVGAGEASFRVERSVGDWSLGRSTLQKTRSFLSGARRLRPRAQIEAARRGQAIPIVRRPAGG
ncbi:MAG TPA: pyridoxamine 5'-phosphate oxidase family protein [Thermomicrobiales bacterium]